MGDLVFEKFLCEVIGRIHSLMGKECPQGRRQRPYFGKIQFEQRTVSLTAGAPVPGVKVLLMHSGGPVETRMLATAITFTPST